jgi:hypothetical protein
MMLVRLEIDVRMAKTGILHYHVLKLPRFRERLWARSW